MLDAQGSCIICMIWIRACWLGHDWAWFELVGVLKEGVRVLKEGP